MTNPILSKINAPTNNPMAQLLEVFKSGNPDAIVQQMMQNNPQFRKFMEDNKGKSPEQIASEHGINLQDAISEVQGVANKLRR